MPACVADLADPAEDADGLVLRRRGGLGPPGRAAGLVDEQDVGEGAPDVDTEPVAHDWPPSAGVLGLLLGVLRAARTMTERACRMCAVMTAAAQSGSPARKASTISAWWARLRRRAGVVVRVEVASLQRRCGSRCPTRRPDAGWSASSTSRSWKRAVEPGRGRRGPDPGRACPTATMARASSSSSSTSTDGRARDGERREPRLEGGAQVEDALELGEGPRGDPGAPVGGGARRGPGRRAVRAPRGPACGSPPAARPARPRPAASPGRGRRAG